MIHQRITSSSSRLVHLIIAGAVAIMPFVVVAQTTISGDASHSGHRNLFLASPVQHASVPLADHHMHIISVNGAALTVEPLLSAIELPQELNEQKSTEPFCPPKAVRDERFCPQRKTRESIRRGCTPLMRAAEAGNLDQVRTLLGRGADVNAAVPVWRITALMLAAGNDHLEVVKTLLKAGANPNAIAFGHGGVPGLTLEFAMDRCHKHWLEMTDAMLAAGLELNPKWLYGSPLGHAIHENDTVMIQALLKRGADVNLADAETGETLLMSAAKYSTTEVVQVLIEAGANVNAKNKLGQTALTLADNGDNLWKREIVALLKQRGAK